eukprot:748391-Hanusia_phi.AAC.4
MHISQAIQSADRTFALFDKDHFRNSSTKFNPLVIHAFPLCLSLASNYPFPIFFPCDEHYPPLLAILSFLSTRLLLSPFLLTYLLRLSSMPFTILILLLLSPPFLPRPPSCPIFAQNNSNLRTHQDITLPPRHGRNVNTHPSEKLSIPGRGTLSHQPDVPHPRLHRPSYPYPLKKK